MSYRQILVVAQFETIQHTVVMKHQFNMLNAWVIFNSVARHLSFSKAAAELYMDKGHISRQIQLLEKSVGTLLLKRTTRSVVLTEDGDQLFQAISDPLRQLSQISKNPPCAEVISGRFNYKIGCTHDFSYGIITKILNSMAIPTEAEVIFELSDKIEDFFNQNIDICFRMNSTVDDRLVAVPMGKVSFVWVRKKDLADAHEKRSLLLPTMEILSRSESAKNMEIPYDLVKYRSNSFYQLYLWVKNGIGVGAVPKFLVAAELQNGELKEQQDLPKIPTIPVFAVYLKDKYINQKKRDIQSRLLRQVAHILDEFSN